MQFFIDTASLDEIQEAADMGVLDGVTTNPSLMRKEGASDFHAHIHKICEIVQGPVSAELVATEYDAMVAEGRELAKIHEHVVVKVPLILDGIKAIKTFTEEGIRTNCTLCFSPTQALIAAKAGASYISPFIGRLDDISTNGMELIRQVVTIYETYGYETEVLAASIRHRLIDAVRFHEASQRDGRRTVVQPEERDPTAHARSPVSDVASVEEIERFQAILQGFPERERLLLRGRIEDDARFQDLAEQLGYSSTSAAKRAFYAAQATLVVRIRQRGDEGDR